MLLRGARRIVWPRNEAIACYTERICIVCDCFFTTRAVHRNDMVFDLSALSG
jgi:hypothetical protein